MIARSSDGIFSGVCAGIAKRLDLEPWLVRFLFVCSIIFIGSGIFFYLLLTLSLPREDRLDRAYDKKIMGVCSMISKRSELDIGLTRFLALLILFTSFGWAIVAYVVLYFALPPLDAAKLGEGEQQQAFANPVPSQNESSSK